MNIFRCTIVIFAICLTLIMMNLLVRHNFRHSHSLPHATKTYLPSKKNASSNLFRSFFNVPHATKTNIRGKNPKKKKLLRSFFNVPRATDTRPQKWVHCKSTGRLANRVRFAVSCYLFAKLTGRKMSFDSVNVNETEVQRYLPFFRVDVPREYPTNLIYAKIVNFFDPLDRNNLACTKLDAPDLIIFRGNHFFAPYLLHNPHYNTTGITVSQLVYELFYIPRITPRNCTAFQVRNGDKASDEWVSDDEIRAMINHAKDSESWFIAGDSMHIIHRFASIMKEENFTARLIYQTGKERKSIFGALIDIRGVAKCHTRFISAWSSFGEFGWVLANASGTTYLVSDGERIPEIMEPDQEGMLPMKAKPIAPYLFQLEGDAIFSNAEWREWKTMFTCDATNEVDFKYGGVVL